MSKLLEQLEALPSFLAFKKAKSENLNINNFYVEHFAPAQSGYYDEKDDDGRQVCRDYHLSDSEREEQAIDNLLADKTDYFDEFVHEVLRNEVTELVRSILKEMIHA